MLIKEFIEFRSHQLNSADSTFKFWSPYYIGQNEEDSLCIDVSKNNHFCDALLNKDYDTAIKAIKSAVNRFEWFGAPGVVLQVDDKGKIIFIKDGYCMGGLDQSEWIICNIAALAYELFFCLKTDDDYDNKIEKDFAAILNMKIPDYNVYPQGTYSFYHKLPV